MATIDKRIRTNNGKQRTTYRARVRIKGSAPITNTFSKLTDARQWAEQTESAIRENRYFPHRQSEKRLLNDAIKLYLADYLPDKSASMRRDQTTQLNWWKDQLGHMRLSDLSDDLIRDRIKALRKDGNKKPASASTANRYRAALIAALSAAIDSKWLADNPALRVKPLSGEVHRERLLSEPEIKRLLAACRDSEQPALYPAVVLALSTGARRMELLGLPWQAVDFKRCVLTFTKTKNGKTREVGITGEGLRVLKDWSKVRRLDSRLVFPGKSDALPIDPKKSWATALRKADIQDFRFHDLRHTAASYLAMSGYSLPEIGAVLGHESMDATQRYAHIAQAHAANVAKVLDGKIFGE